MQPSFSLLYPQLQRLEWVIVHSASHIIITGSFKLFLFAYLLVYFIPTSRLCMLSRFSHVWLFVTLWSVACQVPLSMGFFRQEYGDLPDMGIKPTSLMSPKLGGRFFITFAIWEAQYLLGWGKSINGGLRPMILSASWISRNLKKMHVNATGYTYIFHPPSLPHILGLGMPH